MASAQTVWTGATNYLWNDASNWSTAPVNGDNLVFNTNPYMYVVDNIPDLSIGSLTFESTPDFVTYIYPNNTLTVTGTGIVNNNLTRIASVSLYGSSAGAVTGGRLRLTNSATATFAQLQVNGASTATGHGGSLEFSGNSTAGSVSVNDSYRTYVYAQPGYVAGAEGATVTFTGNSSAASANLQASSGTGLAGRIVFIENATAERATFSPSGAGVIDVSGLSTAGLSVREIAGGGEISVGTKRLTVGTFGCAGTYGGSGTFYGTISGTTGGLTKTGIGTLSLRGSTLQTTVEQGTVNVYGTWNAVNGIRTEIGTTLTITSGSSVALGTTNTLAGTTSYTGTGALFLDSGTTTTNSGTFTANRAAGTSFIIGNGTFTNTGTFAKTGAGTSEMQGTTFTNSGTVNVDAGTLSLTGGATFTQSGGTLHLGTGTVGATLVSTGTPVVFDGGAVRGNGTIQANTEFNRGSLIAPGNSIGRLDFTGNTLWESGAGMQLELLSASTLGNTAGVANDFVNISGSLQLPASGFTLTLAGFGTDGGINGFDPGSNYNWTFATAAGGITGFSPGSFAIVTSAITGATGTWNVSVSGNDLVLGYLGAFAPVPEPSTYALCGLAACATFAAWRRRRMNRETAQRSIAAHAGNV